MERARRLVDSYIFHHTFSDVILNLIVTLAHASYLETTLLYFKKRLSSLSSRNGIHLLSSYARQFTPPSGTTSKNSYTSISMDLLKTTLNNFLSVSFRRHFDPRNLPYHSVIFALGVVIWALIALLYPFVAQYLSLRPLLVDSSND